MPKDLKPHFLKTCSNYCNKKELCERLWMDIKQAYSNPKRYYHNLDHLVYMFDFIKGNFEIIQDPDSLTFAIFYHDIVYDVKRKDNEIKSAEVAQKALNEIDFPTDRIDRIFDMIVATEKHLPTQNHDLAILLDADMAVLGDSETAYDVYAQNVRKEYSIYPNPLYRIGRKKALKKLLSNPSIYSTDLVRAQRELFARANLQRELGAL